MSDSGIHVFRLQPMPGVRDGGEVKVAHNRESLIILLPDESQLLITADRAVYFKQGYMLTLGMWQFVPEATREPVAEAIEAEAEELDPVSWERELRG